MFKVTIRAYLKELNPQRYQQLSKEKKLKTWINKKNYDMENRLYDLERQIRDRKQVKNEELMDKARRFNQARHQAIEILRAELESELRS